MQLAHQQNKVLENQANGYKWGITSEKGYVKATKCNV